METNENIELLSGDNDFEVVEGKHSRTEIIETKNMSYDGTLEKAKLNKQSIHIQRSGCLMAIKKSYFELIRKYWIPGWAHDDFLWKFSILRGSCFYLHTLTMTRKLHSNNTSRKSGRKNNRSKQGRIQQLNEMKKQNRSVMRFLKDNISEINTKKNGSDQSEFNNVDAILNFFDFFNEVINYRIKFLKTRNPFLFFKLSTKYRLYYPRKAGLYLDFCIAYLGDKICQKF